MGSFFLQSRGPSHSGLDRSSRGTRRPPSAKGEATGIVTGAALMSRPEHRKANLRPAERRHFGVNAQVRSRQKLGVYTQGSAAASRLTPMATASARLRTPTRV